MGVTITRVPDGHREADLIARIHLRGIRRLHDLDRRRRDQISAVDCPTRRSSSSLAGVVDQPLPPGRSPPVAAVVVEMMCTVNVLARLRRARRHRHRAAAQRPGQDRAGAAPTRTLDSIVQSRPAFVGNGSFRVTPCASPAPEF